MNNQQNKKNTDNKNTVKKASQGNKCPVSKKCGGCQLWNLSYEEQLKFKQAKVNKLLGNFHKVSTIIGMEHPFHYRNKVQAAFGRTRGGEIISGVYQSSTHNIVKIHSCLIEDKKATLEIVSAEAGWLSKVKVIIDGHRARTYQVASVDTKDTKNVSTIL